MKFTLSWLKDYLDTDADPKRIGEVLTAIGLEVESIHDPADALKDFVVAEIVEAAPHPNASKLQVCRVDDGSGIRQIVCGAANARAGLKTVLAREGVLIPGSGITIRKTKIRDVESSGMLCSAEELGLAEESEGIVELPAHAVPGAPAADALGANDPVFHINVTPNRADCLGVYGIARDLAAAGVGTLNASGIRHQASGVKEGSVPLMPIVALQTPACPLFIGIVIRGVKNRQSQEWLQARLKAIGLRPISALVDVTNYFTHSFARPLHAYDLAKLNGGITVREAREGERLVALNDKEYALQPNMTVIADESGVLGLGGIIGGAGTGCDENTTDVFLEAALFDPANIAETGRTLDLHTDARARFERGVDPAFTLEGAKMAAAMIVELCGGAAEQPVTAGAAPEWKRSLAFDPRYVSRLGGVSVPREQCARILRALGCGVEEKNHYLAVSPPSWRRDIEGQADLVEEILRIHGYDAIPATPLPKPAHAAKPALNHAQKRNAAARRALAARGMLEACTWSFLPEAWAKRFGGGSEALKLLNPISNDLSDMRPSLLPNLLAAARDNAYRGAHDLALFEVGARFFHAGEDGQQAAAAGLRCGNRQDHAYLGERFNAVSRPVDAFDAKADLLALLEALDFNAHAIAPTPSAPDWYHPGRSGTLSLGKTALAHFGELHPSVLLMFDIKTPVVGFELALDSIPLPKARSRAKTPLHSSDYPAVERDFAFVVESGVPAASLIRAVSNADKQLIRDVCLFDVYSGKGMEDGRKSVALRVTLQAGDRTLNEAEITAVQQAIIAAAAKHCGAALRQ